MLEKNTKITVLRKMIGLGEEIEPQYIVPHNSILNLRQKMGLSEQPAVSKGVSKNVTSNEPCTMKCPHCENMAKNFLYLESLIRSNYSPKYECSLCQSSLKYLQYVNKSIMQVFGNFDSIVAAAQAFAVPRKRKFSTNTSFAALGVTAARAVAAEKAAAASMEKTTNTDSKRSLLKRTKKPKKTKTSKQMSSKADLTRSSDDLKQDKQRAKTQLKALKAPTKPVKVPTPHRSSLHNTTPKRALQVTYVRNNRYPTSKKTTTPRTNIMLRVMKQKNVKPKRTKVAVRRLKTNA